MMSWRISARTRHSLLEGESEAECGTWFPLDIHSGFQLVSKGENQIQAERPYRSRVHTCRKADAVILDRELELFAATRSSSRSRDRKSTRLNSSHTVISYAVFCLKKKKI